ncbi:MAG: phosphoglycolate phosphatase [Haloarculaceae archaeon]
MEPAVAIPESAPPLVVDIDGTLTDDRRALDPRVIPVLRAWPDDVVVATGKSMPYPVALCEFLSLEPNLIAENGGVVLVGREGTLEVVGDRAAADAMVADFEAAGYDLGWGAADLVNRWRETEVAVAKDAVSRAVLAEFAGEHGLEVVDTGYAYHVKSPDVDKGTGLTAVAEELDRDLATFLAVGDSENDAPMFELVGQSVAVANADETAKSAADFETEAAFADGFFEAIRWLSE